MFGDRTLIASFMRNNEIKALKGTTSNEAEDVSGRTSAEIERVIYARVTNFDFLERATGAERQEQWSVKIPKTEENAGSGSIRVRKVTNLREPGAAVQYVLTTKLDIGNQGSSAETSEQSSVDQFNVFKYLANKGMLKDRYIFSIEGSDLNWEVDCFPKPGEMYYEWVKIDLEHWPRDKELPQLPMVVAEMIDGSEGQQTEEAKAKISKLYEEVFLMANTKDPLASYEEESSGQPGVATDEEGQNKDNDDGSTQNNSTADGDAGNGGADGNDDGAGKSNTGNGNDDDAGGKGKAGTEGGEEPTGTAT